MSEQTTPQNKPENAGGVMAGKRGLIMGVANDRSIAWGIAAKLAEQGAELAFTFQGEALEKRVRPLAASVDSDLVLPCDVTDEQSVDAVFSTLAEKWASSISCCMPSPIRQGRAKRPICRYQPREFPTDDGYLGLFLHSYRAKGHGDNE